MRAATFFVCHVWGFDFFSVLPDMFNPLLSSLPWWSETPLLIQSRILSPSFWVCLVRREATRGSPVSPYQKAELPLLPVCPFPPF